MSRPLNLPVRNRILASLTALTLTAVIAGCSNDDDAPEPNDSTEAADAATSEYVPASADGPAQNVPEPNLPAVATENTEEGAEASFHHFWEAEEHARLTGDTAQIAFVSSSDCAFCRDSIEGWGESYEDGAWTSINGELTADITELRTTIPDEGESSIAHVYFQLYEPDTDFYDAEGNQTTHSFEAPEVKDWFALMEYDATAQRWYMEWLGLEENVIWED